MNKQEIVSTLDIKYQIAVGHQDMGEEVPELLSKEIDELEQLLIQKIQGA